MSRFDRRARTGMLVGALAMFFALDVAFLLSMAGMPFAADALGQAIIDVLPGWISIPLIDALHEWAKRLLVIGVIALFLIDGAATGLLAASPRRRNALVVGVGLLPWVAAFVLARIFSPQRIEPVTSFIDAAVGAAVFLASLAFILPSALDRGPSPLDGIAEAGPASPARRRALLGTAAIAAALAIVSLPLSRVAAVGSGGLGNVATAARRLRTRAEIPAADPKGVVQSPFELTYDQLLDLEAVEQVHTLECISNYVGGDLISTALWTGVPLRDLLNRAGVNSGAYDVAFTSVDGYTDSISIAKAMDERTLVAYLMNGKTVPQDHGYPARMLVPDIYGMKNVKWIKTIEVVNYDFRGYWMQQGWSDSANVNTNARIDLPAQNVRWTGGPVTVAGIAFAGARGISKVELSTDGGNSWGQATLETQMSQLTWRRWSYQWTPSGAGPAKLVVRATDGTGNTETPIGRQPYPDGATGYDSVDVTVQRA
jgi:hypothetical protein